MSPTRACGLSRPSLLLALLVGCASADPKGAGGDSATDEMVDVDERAPGERTVRTAPCDALDEHRCLLPFPSTAFLEEDPSSPTGLRVAVEDASLPGTGDEASYLNLADGFSPVTPVATMLAGGIDPSFLADAVKGEVLENAPLRIVNAEPGHPDYGQEIPLWMDRIEGGVFEAYADLLLGFPLVPMDGNTEYAVIVDNSLVDLEGNTHAADHPTRVALGIDAPETDEEVLIGAHHAPLRQLLDDIGQDPEQVVRAWSFVTRSDEDVSRRMLHMMDTAAGALEGIDVRITAFVSRDDPAIEGIVVGELDGVPNFLDAENRLQYDDDRLPIQQGTRTSRFRVVLPAAGYPGEGERYRITLYGHGTGGSVNDDAFDAEIAAEGVAKVNLEFHGWTGDDLVFTFRDLLTLVKGSEQSTAQLMQAVVDGYALLKAVEGPLGEALAAETLAGEPNPRAGVVPIAEDPGWVGGSLGGTMGAIIGAAYPEVQYGVLNVPAGAWSHFVCDSYMYESAMRGLLLDSYETEIEVRYAMALIQGGWDDVDGASWAARAREDGVSFLLQESIDDRIVPNQATHTLASALEAKMVGEAFRDIPTVESAGEVRGGVGITQYWVPPDEPLRVHGFAARDTPAAEAAMEQILHFMHSAWAGEPEVVLPEACAETGSCDFRDAWVP